METTFGLKLRESRQKKGLTLRALAEARRVNFTYLSKIENDKIGYLPGADTIRDLAGALEVDAIELLQLANKLPPELRSGATQRRVVFFRERGRSRRRRIGTLCLTCWSRGNRLDPREARKGQWVSFQWSFSTDKLFRRSQRQFSVRFVVWLNPFWGPVAEDGKTLEQNEELPNHVNKKYLAFPD